MPGLDQGPAVKRALGAVLTATAVDLWVLSRTPPLAPDDNATVRAWLSVHGFDLSRLQARGASVAYPDAPR